MNDEATVIPNLKAMNLSLRVNCSVLRVAENSPEIARIRELGAKHSIRFDV